MSPRELSDIKEAEAKAKREANPEVHPICCTTLFVG
jgi:hypothetical protein